MTSGALTLIITAAILLQVAVGILIGLYRRRGQYRGENERGPAELREQTPASSSAREGFREFSVQRREFEDAKHAVCSFYLEPVDAQPLPPFLPGQFLTFKLSIDDPLTHQARTAVRCYSLSDAPRPDHYRVSIKRVPAPEGRPDLPPGLSSNFFHDHVQAGTRLWIKAPSGHFHLMEDEPLAMLPMLPMVLIGGGIGVTPMLSMVNSVLERGVNREVWFYYGVRNGDEQIMKEQLQGLARRHQNLHLHVCYSAPKVGEVEGVDYQHRGRVDIQLLRATLNMMRYQFYVCGPKAMMESVIPALEDWGVASGDIYYESFGPATLIRHVEATPVTTTQPITVTFSRSGKSIPWDPTAASLLEFAEAHGIEVESGCRAGSCGCCQTIVNSGEVDYNQEPDADILPGNCLLCISRPKSDLTLNA